MGKLQEAVKRYQVGHGQADIHPDQVESDEWEAHNLITNSDIAKQVKDQGLPPPRLQTLFQKTTIPVYNQPSDFINFQSFPLTQGANATKIVQPQLEGVGCRATILGAPAANDIILLATALEFVSASAVAQPQNNTFILPSPTGVLLGHCPITISTLGEIWAIEVGTSAGGTGFVSVMLESYDPDAHTWEAWQAGKE